LPIELHTSQKVFGHISYLNRTARDFLELPDIWEILLYQTKHSGFDPKIALLTSYVMQVKATDLIIEASSGYRVDEALLFMASRMFEPNSKTHIELVEELDRALTTHWVSSEIEYRGALV
jgi:hypothetical protein